MRLYARSVFDHISRQIQPYVKDVDHTGKLLFMMPAVPAAVAIEVGNLLADYCAQYEKLSLPLIKTASGLFREWAQSEDPEQKQTAEEIAEKGWRDEQGNLTGYRNTMNEDSTRIMVVLLIGVDRVMDSSSLVDFHQCDVDMIWTTELGSSCRRWTQAVLDANEIGYERETLDHFDQVLVPLIEAGLADLFQISAFLEVLNLTSSQDGRDAEQVVLRNLDRFGLPVFGRYRFSGRPGFGTYLEDAIAFFSYDAYLEERSKKRALKTIEKYIQNENLGELFDESERGWFETDEAFVDAVKRYIEERHEDLREQLMQCDFVTIRDRILRYRPPRSSKPRPVTVKKLTGGAVEVILSGLWATLADFKRTAIDQGVLPVESLKEIHIRSELFKHDCDEGDSAQERTLAARRYLERLVGGVDAFIEEWIDSERLCGESHQIIVVSELVRPDLNCQPARTGEPCLQFSVTLTGEDLDETIAKYFAWRLPDIQPYRLADELLYWAVMARRSIDGYCLPVFHLPYHEELMLAKDDEEVRRVLRQCIQDEGGVMFNLLDASGADAPDPMKPSINRLAFEYDRFIQRSGTDGLHVALMGDEWHGVRKAYEQVCDKYLKDPECIESPLATLLFRAFLVVQRKPEAEGDRWVWEAFEPSAAVTILHPALWEMLQSHLHYLVTCFNSIAGSELRRPGARAFRDIVWQNYVDLAAIETPLCGILKDRDRLLDTHVRGEGLVHRIGQAGSQEASLTTRLLLRYDPVEDEGVSDAELFRESRESMLISRILTDYWRLHSHVDDGLSIAVFQNHDIQPVISAIDRFLTILRGAAAGSRPPFALTVTFFSESSDDSNIGRWITQWRERWEASENQSSLAHYRQLRLSVSHRIVSPKDYYRQFRVLTTEGIEVDIAMFCDFIGAGEQGNVFEPSEPYDVRTRTLKFPILEKPFCAVRSPGQQLFRARVLSNRQFRVTSQHTELMARLSRRKAGQNENHIVLGFGDYTPWQGVLDAMHQHAGWVVCIDPNIDERLIAQKGEISDETREIIGFGSGVGAHGESNYTISTEQFRLGDVLNRLTASIGEVYATWSSRDCFGVAKSVMAEVKKLSGLSLVRATGLGHYIRDFMAYALTRKMLRVDGTILCDHLISLDAYQHWFESAESDTRPDLLWVVADICEDGRINVDLRLIECKLAKKLDIYLDKAHQQLENGLRHLVSTFMPRDDIESTEDDRPDQRYWWLQLHRLIASASEVTLSDQSRVLTALERMTEGEYNIQWRAAAITFWTDKDDTDLAHTESWTYSARGQDLGINVLSCGSEFVRRLCSGEIDAEIPWIDPRYFSFKAKVRKLSDRQDEDIDGERSGEIDDHAAILDHEKTKPIVEPLGGDRTDPITKTTDEISDKEARRHIPERILLGTTVSGSRPIYWEFGHGDLSNRHMLIFGTSGMGKTYAIQCLLCELAKKGLNSLLIDYTNGFLPNQLEPEMKIHLDTKQHVIRQSPLPINPFRLQSTDFGGLVLPETETAASKRIASIFQKVYDLGDQQFSVLFDALSDGLRKNGEKMTLDLLMDILVSFLDDDTKNKTAIQTTRSKIRPFVMENPFQPGAEALDWLSIFNEKLKRCHIFQLAGLDFHTWRLATEFALWDFYAFLQSSGSKDDPKVVVLDEVQNLDHREGSPLSRYLREGRKFGVSLIMATQTMSNLAKDERDRLFNAGHKLFFKPADTEIKSYADIVAVSAGEKVDVWMKRLAGLQKGQCYSLGPSLNPANEKLDTKSFKIKVTSLNERFGND